MVTKISYVKKLEFIKMHSQKKKFICSVYILFDISLKKNNNVTVW